MRKGDKSSFMGVCLIKDADKEEDFRGDSWIQGGGQRIGEAEKDAGMGEVEAEVEASQHVVCLLCLHQSAEMMPKLPKYKLYVNICFFSK